MNKIQIIEKYVQDIRQKFEEMNRHINKDTNYGVAVDAITAPFLPPLVRRHYAQSIPSTGILLDAYSTMQDINKELTAENEHLKAELHKAVNYINNLQAEQEDENDDDCANCPNAGSCLTYMLNQAGACDCESEEDITEGKLVVSVTWLDGGTVQFLADSTKQMAGESLIIGIEDGNVVIPLNNVRFFSIN